MKRNRQTSDNLPLFWELVAFTRCEKVKRDKTDNPQANVPCPDCGELEFDFSPKGANCFRQGACGYRGSLQAYAKKIGYSTGGVYVHPPVYKTRKPAKWQENPQRYLDEYVSASDVFERWQAYKPVNLDTIIQYQLGVGVLPASRCHHKRLIVPLLEDGKIVGFRGRAIDCECKKWLTCGSSRTILFGLEQVCRGDVVYWLENMVDAMLLMQVSQLGFRAVASTAGAGCWREFIEPLVARQPKVVIVALDNDLAGQANPQTQKILIEEHIRKHGKKPRPGLHGFKIAAALANAGIQMQLIRWPESAPPKADGLYLLGLDKLQ